MTVSPTLDARFREAAAAAGLLDVAYDLAETPIGTLLVATTDRGVCRISYDPEPERDAESLAHTFSSTSTSRASAPSSSCRSTSGTRRRSAVPCSTVLPVSPMDT